MGTTTAGNCRQPERRLPPHSARTAWRNKSLRITCPLLYRCRRRAKGNGALELRLTGKVADGFLCAGCHKELTRQPSSHGSIPKTGNLQSEVRFPAIAALAA